MRQARRAAALLAAAGIVACRGQAVPLAGRHVTPDSAFAALVDSLVPAVEQAAGVRFRSPPRSAVRTRDQVRAYLAAKLDHDLPPSRARNLARAYQLLRLLPDSVNLRRLLLDLLAEQVVGYYDPDSATLFGVAGAPPEQLRLMAAHEMVHALQGQYLNLDSLLAPGGDNDRATAAQSILEGQAMLGSLRALLPAVDILGSDSLWHELRTQAVAAERSAPRFGAAPLIVREGLVFPYLDGAEFMRWWGRTPAGQADSMPWGARMPVSTEQILHPDRYARGDRPVRLRFRGGPAADSVLQEDALGEMEIGVMLALAAGAPQPVYQPALGWGGGSLPPLRHSRRAGAGLGGRLRRRGVRGRLSIPGNPVARPDPASRVSGSGDRGQCGLPARRALRRGARAVDRLARPAGRGGRRRSVSPGALPVPLPEEQVDPEGHEPDESA